MRNDDNLPHRKKVHWQLNAPPEGQQDNLSPKKPLFAKSLLCGVFSQRIISKAAAERVRAARVGLQVQ